MAENIALLQDAVTRIPVWTGDGNDIFTPDQWLQRIEKARVSAAFENNNCTNLNRVSNNKHCKYHCVVLSSFGQTNQLTQ